MKNGSVAIVLVSVISLFLPCCGPTYRMTPPPAFSRYVDSSDFKMITADGVRLKAREVENYPRAELSFWKDALQRHLEKRGYLKKSENCFRTESGLDGCTLDFLLPYGAEDWVMSETIFVVDDRVVLVEVTGPYERFKPYEESIKKYLLTFNPGQ